MECRYFQRRFCRKRFVYKMVGHMVDRSKYQSAFYQKQPLLLTSQQQHESIPDTQDFQNWND